MTYSKCLEHVPGHALLVLPEYFSTHKRVQVSASILVNNATSSASLTGAAVSLSSMLLSMDN